MPIMGYLLLLSGIIMYFLFRPLGEVLHIVMRTVLPAHLWGYVGGDLYVSFPELDTKFQLHEYK